MKQESSMKFTKDNFVNIKNTLPNSFIGKSINLHKKKIKSYTLKKLFVKVFFICIIITVKWPWIISEKYV